MAKFGAFQVNRACRHAFGNLEMELEPGRYEPTSSEELAAMEHLTSVPPAAEPEAFAVKLEDPDAPEAETAVHQVPSEPNLPEPPAAGGSEPPASDEPPATATDHDEE